MDGQPYIFEVQHPLLALLVRTSAPSPVPLLVVAPCTQPPRHTSIHRWGRERSATHNVECVTRCVAPSVGIVVDDQVSVASLQLVQLLPFE
jgi:hypothetical protein